LEPTPDPTTEGTVEQLIRDYKPGPLKGTATKQFLKDARELATQGWFVHTIFGWTDEPFHPNTLTVFYRRQSNHIRTP